MDVLNLIQGSLNYSKKKGRALYNITPKDYGNLPKRKRRLSELGGYQGDSSEISVFNKNRESKRYKRVDSSSQSHMMGNMSDRVRHFNYPDPFKKNDNA